jgi:glutathione synthase/RimK-type ligase-like ATP-grasp enzyme
MKILALKAGKQPYDVDFINYFNKYGEKNGNVYTMGYLDDLVFEFNNEIKISIDGTNVLDFDIVYFRTWEKRPDAATTLAKHLSKHSKKFFDTAVGMSNYGSKLLQHYVLTANGLNLPKSFVIHNNILKQHLENYVTKLGGYPVVLKASRGNEGKGVYLLNSFEDFLNIEGELKDLYYFIQEFIPNDFDYRFVVFGEEVKVIKKRVRNSESKEFRNNVSLGAEVEYIDPATLPELCDIAVKAAKAKNLQVAGIDIVINKINSNIYVFEANPSPAFRNDFTVLEHLDNYFKSVE